MIAWIKFIVYSNAGTEYLICLFLITNMLSCVPLLYSFFSGVGQRAKPGGNISKCTCYPFVNDSREFSVGNRWVTLFPPCCLHGISIHPCCWKAFYPLALFPLAKWLHWNVNLFQEPEHRRRGVHRLLLSGQLHWCDVRSGSDEGSRHLSRACNHHCQHHHL